MLHLDAALRHKLVAPGNFWLHGSMAQHLTVPRASNASMARHAKSVVLRQAHQRDLRRFTIQEVMDLPFKKWQHLAKQPMFEAPQPYQRTRGIASDRACQQDCNRTWLSKPLECNSRAPAVAHVIAVHMERCTSASCSHHSNCRQRCSIHRIWTISSEYSKNVLPK